MIRPHKQARVQADLILDCCRKDCCNADLSFPSPLFGYASFKSGPIAIECSEAFQALEHLRSYGHQSSFPRMRTLC